MENKITQSEGKDTLQNVLTEKEVTELLGLTKKQLSALRTNGQLPFLKVNRNCRLYLESDLVTWLKSKKVVLNKAN